MARRNDDAVSYGYNYTFQPSVIVPLWGNIDVVRWQWELLVFAIGEFLFSIPIFVMWGLRVIPSVTPLWQYCAIYYIVLIPAFISNIFMSDSRSKELYLFAGIANFFVFGVISWVLALNLYDVISCWLQTIPQTCRNTMTADLIVTFITIILWILTLVIALAYLSIWGRIRQSNSIKGVTLQKVRPYS
jgi:hypothetical protein